MENQLLKTLTNNKLLKNVDISKINLRNIKGKLITISEGAILYRDGDPVNSIYLIVSGEINLVRKKLLGKTRSLILSEDEFLGNDEFFDETTRTSTAVALKDSYLIELVENEVHELIKQDSGIFENLRESQYGDMEGYLQKADVSDELFTTLAGDKAEPKPVTEDQEGEFKESGVDEFGGSEGEPKVPDFQEVIKEEFDEETLKALEGLDEDIQKISRDVESKVSLNEDDAAFFAGLSSMEDTQHVSETPQIPPEPPKIPEEKKPEKEIKKAAVSEPSQPRKPSEKKREETVEKSKLAKEKKAHEKQLEGEFMTTDQLEMIIKAAQLVNSNIQLDDVLKNIVDVATNLTNADRGTLYLVDKENNILWSKIAMGNEMREIRLNMGEGVAGWVAQSGEIVNIEDVKTDKRFKSDVDKSSGYVTKNMLCFPIKNKKEEVVGVLQLLNNANGKFSGLEQEFLSAISIHAALALENAELVEKLLHGERVSSLGKMANFLIQDIKKPVLVSKRYAEHLKTKELPPEAVQVLDMMLEQLNQVADLVQTTSSYSEGKRILHTLNANISQTMEDYAQRMASYVQTHNCEIVNNVDAQANIKLDVKEFYQCYMHIVRNACDAMPDGGKIVIYSTMEEKFIALAFKDTGLGIPDSIKDKIFEPFTSHGKKEGTGLGLSITKQIVEAHGGTISVESNLGEGATILIKLPVTSKF
ncbi:MAG: hypothetical protein A2V66_06170 [Ignavibacteria bacterium RBG_13_36_8]|nr:MAG: hypothetical protein A2V66_06170 [Ignavibacteria bacterium RBG_13_36_8]